MPRIPRREIIAPHLLYHITVRGNNQQNIFLSNIDYDFLIGRLKFYHDKMEFSLYAYVLMKNHFHLLIETGEKDSISQIMQPLNTSYVVYFSKKYHRSGHIFQGRFYAKIVDKDNYLLEAVRYLHLNPVKINLVKHPRNYRWSSYNEYIGKIQKNLITDCYKVLEIFGGDIIAQRSNFISFIQDGINHGTVSKDIFTLK